MGTDESIIEAARMSTGKGFISWDPYFRCDYCEKVYLHTEEQKSEGILIPVCPKHNRINYPRGDAGLLEHLYKNKHMTPFEMCELVIEVQAPIFVFREWHRHRTQSFNEFSARYSVMPNLHYIPNKKRLLPKVTANKQESGMFHGALPINLEGTQEALALEQNKVYDNYDRMLGFGIPKEVARINTPVSRYSKMRAKANLRNWLGFLMLRKAKDAQWEIRQFADVVGNIVEQLWPRAYALFLEHDFNAVRFSASEMKTLKALIYNLSHSTGEQFLYEDALNNLKVPVAIIKSIKKKIDGE